jgi:prolipoprotein diacylglyceryltransferase
LPWAITFPPHSHAGATYDGVALHPTQLYLSAAGFLIFALLWSGRRRIAPPGRLFSLFLLLQCLARFVIDFFRHYEDGGETLTVLGWSLSLTQVVCLVLIAIALIGVLRRPRVEEAVVTAGDG